MRAQATLPSYAFLLILTILLGTFLAYVMLDRFSGINMIGADIYNARNFTVRTVDVQINVSAHYAVIDESQIVYSNIVKTNCAEIHGEVMRVENAKIDYDAKTKAYIVYREPVIAVRQVNTTCIIAVKLYNVTGVEYEWSFGAKKAREAKTPVVAKYVCTASRRVSTTLLSEPYLIDMLNITMRAGPGGVYTKIVKLNCNQVEIVVLSSICKVSLKPVTT